MKKYLNTLFTTQGAYLTAKTRREPDLRALRAFVVRKNLAEAHDARAGDVSTVDRAGPARLRRVAKA